MGDEKTPQLLYQMISGYKMPTYEEIKAQIPAITQKVIAVKSAIKSTPSTSELAHYRDNNGEMHTTTTGNGAISGTDPLASFAVDTYVGGKIIGGLTKVAMYGVGKYGPGWIKQKARNHIIGQEFKKGLLPSPTLFATLKPNGQISKKYFGISKEQLPNYAIPNWNGDNLQLTKNRLANGGFARLANSTFPYNKETAQMLLDKQYQIGVLSKQPIQGTLKDINNQIFKLGFTDMQMKNCATSYPRVFFTSVPTDHPKYVLFTKNNIIPAHEFSHYVYEPQVIPNFFNNSGGYYQQANGSEIMARATQLKNYFGLKENEKITDDMLKYAADNYVKDTGIDNNMTDFFNRIDWKHAKEFVEYINNFSPAIAAGYFQRTTQKTK